MTERDLLDGYGVNLRPSMGAAGARRMSGLPLAAPFPYFGGKRRAAHLIWERLGDPSGYVEPFAGSAAVLLARPEFTGRRVETLNDADGWLVNAWRAIQQDPAIVAQHAYGPVTEIDYHARLAWLTARRTPDLVSWLEGDPENHDAKAAGWWLYVLACGIGDPFGGGPWHVIDGHLRKLPHLGNAGRGVNRELPHLGNAGRGVNRELPHLGNAGQGVNRELPHLGNAGQELVDYLGRLADRLRRVRITCGDWRRVCQPSVIRSGADGDGSRALFMDPPYATSGDLYAHGSDGDGISAAVREWCATKADSAMRIVLSGYDDEHDDLMARGWTKIAGRAGGGAGYSVNPLNGRRERLWLSPACLGAHEQIELGLGA
jgi:site-specific DNA-adenine methylase